MLYEFRRVTCAPGTLGVFRSFAKEHLERAYAKHGIEAVAYFEVVIGPGMADQFPYLLRWTSFDDRAEKLAALENDSEFKQLLDDRDSSAPVVVNVSNQLWRNMPYAEFSPIEATASPGLYEYRISHTLPGKKGVVHWRNEEWNVPLYNDIGMPYVGVWDPIVGDSSFVHYMLRWNSIEERDQKWQTYFEDPRWQEISKKTGPLTVAVPNEIWRPTSFSPLLK